MYFLLKMCRGAGRGRDWKEVKRGSRGTGVRVFCCFVLILFGAYINRERAVA